MYDTNGSLLRNKEVSDGFDIVWNIIADAFKHSNESCAKIDPELSLKDFFNDRLRTTQLDARARNLVLELAETWGGFVGDAVERNSLKWFWLEECLDGGVLKSELVKIC